MDETLDLSTLIRDDVIRNFGLLTPNRKIRPTAQEFRNLIDEGWRLWLDEDGYVLGYLPPSLWDRMASGWE